MPQGSEAVPFGAWPSPLSPEVAAAGGARFGGLALGGAADGTPLLWFVATHDGRNELHRAVGDGPPVLVESVRSARTRVNEYGGGAIWAHGDTLFVVEDADQCVYRLGPGDEVPVALTTEGPARRAWRYAAGVVEPSGRWMVVERELHDPSGSGEAVNDLAWLPTGVDGAGEPRTAGGAPGPVPGGAGRYHLAGGADFLAAPALSPDGRHLAWLRWDHPDMPWDAAELWAAEVVVVDGAPELRGPRRVAGGRVGGAVVSACLPSWSPEGRLHWCDDREDLWWLRSSVEVGLPGPGGGDDAPALRRGGEVGEPRWVSGGSRYGFGDGFLVLAETVGGLDRVVVLGRDPATGRVVAGPSDGDGSPGAGSPGAGSQATEDLTGASWVDGLAVRGATVAAVAGFAEHPTAVVLGGPSGSRRLHAPPWPLPAASVSVPRPVTFPTPPVASPGGDEGAGEPARDSGGNEVAHGLFHPPRLEDVEGPAGSLPPLVVRIHGGPTANARAELSPSVQFWTTRGFAVLEVNYRGSTGFGRAYRDRLRGGWGEVEVQDCIAAAEHLVREGLVDGSRCVIRGGSAGGFTALEAVSADPTASGFRFAAATTLYGVTDLMALAGDTHKFESRYLDGLVGPLPGAEATYRDRSPLYHPDRIAAPVLVLQGLEDPIVPPSQAEVLVAALEANGIDHEYRTYAGEGHGFRQEATVVDALGAELAFYRRVLALGP